MDFTITSTQQPDHAYVAIALNADDVFLCQTLQGSISVILRTAYGPNCNMG
jgi:flagellar biosynthesis/type III secretory pathway M-ring protein FliF/YscJ